MANDILNLKNEDALKLLSCSSHLGTQNSDFQMMSYVYKRRPDGIHIINIKKTWEKLVLAARAIAAIEDPAEVYVISSRPFGQRAVLKYAVHTGATPIAGRFTPGTFTNQIQKAFKEPRLLVVCDPRTDAQPIREASYVNLPVVAFANTDSPLRFVDIAIPCNNKNFHSIGLMWWLLAREVLRIRGTLSREKPWNIMVDLFFFRDLEEIEKEEQSAVVEKTQAVREATNYASDWIGNTGPGAPGTFEEITDWAADEPAVPAAALPTGEWTGPTTGEWQNQTKVASTGQDWGGAGAADGNW